MNRNLLKPSLNWLLVFVPVALVLRFIIHVPNETWLFTASCLAIIPLAGWMGRATEQLAEHMGQGIGGLLNATFGNAAELIIAILALSKGFTGVVKASLTGSIIGNILLVLGVSMVAGGSRYSRQVFNQTAARASNTSLTLAAIALLVPGVFHYLASHETGGWTPQRSQQLSLAIAVVLLLVYVCSLAFSLKTHRKLFLGEHHDGLKGSEAPEWSKGKSIGILMIATVLVAILSEALVGTIEGARARWGLTETFVGVIVVAIVGNAAEHSTAVLMAWKNKMDLALGIAIGSSLQIALFVAPLLVMVSYFFPHQMNLEFSLAEIVAIIAAVHLVAQISGDGESNWLEGIQLVSVYVLLGILFYFLPASSAPH